MEMTPAALKEMIADIVKGALERQQDALQTERNKTGDLAKDLLEAHVANLQQATKASDNAKTPPGTFVARCVRALAATKGDTERAAKLCEKWYGGDDPATKALMVSEGTAGGFVVMDEWAAEIIELLRPATIMRSMNPIIIPMGSATFTLPKLTGGAVAGYVSESAYMSTTEQAFGSLKLTFKKLAALIPISNDMIRYAVPQTDVVIRDDLISALAQRQDLAFIRNDGTEDTPRGLKNWVTTANSLSAQSSTTLAKTTQDLGSMILALMNGNVRMLRPGWLMAPRTMVYLATVRDSNGNFAFRDEVLAGKLWGYPIGVTTQIPINLGSGSDSELYFADFADVVIGDAMGIQLDASSEAAYYDGTTVVAAFSKDQTVIRAIAEHDFGMRHDASVAVMDEVAWSPT